MRRPTFTPDRLVRIIAPCNIQLSVSHSEVVDYVALSYCWGTSTPLSTTKTNLSDHLRQISWSMVPKTFRQAIDLTLMLGYEYIWIDSLCIIQQDSEDFAKQSSKMGKIYMCAVLVISADSGQSVEAGFLEKRLYASTTIRIPIWKRQPHSADRVFAKPIPIDYDQRDDHTSFGSDPTFARAWCFQEQRMATRIVHFTTSEMSWGCGSDLTCECGRLGWTDYGDNPELLQRYFNSLESTSDERGRAPSTVEFWWSLIESFSRRRLTRVTDRLPSISGLAKLMQCEELGEYYAGMWERQLPISLLWTTDDLVGSQHYPWRPLEYIGPTWSWVSLMGIVQRPEWAHDRKVVANIDKVYCVRNSTDSFGTIASASITITAPATTDNLQHGFSKYSDGSILRCAELASGGLKNEFLDLRPNRNPEEDSSPYLGEVLCLLIARPGKEYSEALLLTKSATLNGVFERIGTLIMYERQDKEWGWTTVTII